ncbi:MAG: NlpC/P60 family protein [Nitrospirae bacterium]|nr:MAG: NlpC/P60 family protein [Nitrospirota bacterium]
MKKSRSLLLTAIALSGAISLAISIIISFLAPEAAFAAGRSRHAAKSSARNSAQSSVMNGSAPKLAIVNTPAAGVFAKTSESSERVSEVLLGDEFRVTSLSRGWACGTIPSQKGYKGCLLAKNLIFPKKDDFFRNSSFLQVKEKRSLLTLANGTTLPVNVSTRLPVTGRTGETFEVLLPDGSTGSLQASACVLEDENFGRHVAPEDIMNAAAFLGADYKWGGITASGMDCSGFVYTVFRMNGILLKRDSYMQADEGREIPMSDLQAGDLLFFKSKNGKRISHVGIYIGYGNFIHASKSMNSVTISSLDGPFKKNLAAVRRILKTAKSQELRA